MLANKTSRREFLFRSAAGTLALAGGTVLTPPAAGAEASPSVSQKPNIIFILVDDLGWAELGCYGNRFNETPHLDALAADGVRFTDAYASAPVCSPTRASIMTGQYPARVGITDYLRGDDPKYLSPDFITLPEVLREQGYRTALIGKWHLMGDYKLRKGDPHLHGFDEVICSETAYIGAGSYFHPYKFMPEVQAKEPNEYLTDRLNAEAVDFIERHKNRPFFLYLSHYAPHTRLVGKEPLVAKYKAKPGAGQKQNNPLLAAMLESIDEGVGKITDTLIRLGLADNTAVVFMSDNGGELNVTSNAPLRGGKSQLYEGGIRVPLIIRWPARAGRGLVCREPVGSTDLYPTFIEMAGGRCSPKQICDGESFLPLLRGQGSLKRPALFWHYPLDQPHFLGGRSSSAVRAGDFKLIDFFQDNRVELYNLREDLGETADLSQRRPDKAKELREILKQWKSSL
ncbi:MAG: sulfatase [Candidatus Sumerlaeia bacterium]|nr:sulfatase [Candidatus Sumerlaeia bacterium]